MKKIVFLFIALVLAGKINAQIKLPSLISDGMILQRDVDIKIWGWAAPKEKIEISFLGKKYRTQAEQNGDWSLIIPKQAAGGPYELKLKGKNELIIKNILFGDVWFCSGQSNMVHQMKLHSVRYAQEIQEANNTLIRHFGIPTATELNGPLQEFKQLISWKETNPENVKEFSAVAYFFALKIHKDIGVPIGLINASVGGTPIEAWTSESGLKNFDILTSKIDRNKDSTYINSFNRKAGFSPNEEINDKGLLAKIKWFEPQYEPLNWKTIHIPGFWEDQGIKDLNGTVWYRREISIPASMLNKEAKVFLGRIVDADELYINGEKIGKTTYQYPQRRYSVPKGLLKPGKNLFTIRVTNYNGKGGFVPDKPYCLIAGKDTIDLKGDWKYRVGEVFPPAKPEPTFSNQNQPTSLFNAMVAPAIQYSIKGILWYQGESNAGRSSTYEALQKAQIMDWRAQWKNPDLPFLFVQLPNFMESNYLPSESNWAEMRQAQLNSLSISNTAMAIAIDLGEWNDIHPDNKKSVGERLALAAEKLVYKKDIVASGPLFDNLSVVENKLILNFKHTGSGLISKDGEPLREFAIAGADKKFVWAKTQISGNSIELWNEDIKTPRFVRYAWSDNPDVKLYNQEGLPASPFEASLPEELWHGKKAAVVLTYDDALNVHLDNAIPALQERGLSGSFYLTSFAPASKNRIKEWRQAAENGHELGNHTLHHPCDASKPGRDWVSAEKDLSKYSTERIVHEIQMTNVYLEAIDGKKERTFAYTCGDTETDEGSFVEAIKNDFEAARGVRPKLNEVGNINLQNIDCFVVNGHSAEEMIEWVKQAEKSGALLTILFHGVGGEHGLNVSLEDHNLLLDYLASNKESIWTTTLLEAAKHVKKFQ